MQRLLMSAISLAAIAVLVAVPQSLFATPLPPIKARVIKVESLGSDRIVTISRGSDDGVAKDWTACFVDANDQCRPQGELVLIRVAKHTSLARAKVSVQQITALPYVKLSAP